MYNVTSIEKPQTEKKYTYIRGTPAIASALSKSSINGMLKAISSSTASISSFCSCLFFMYYFNSHSPRLMGAMAKF